MEHLEHKTKVTIMMAVMAALLFASVNQTIVGTALPKIIADLGGFEYYSWIFTIYMLTTSITAILVGKLSDIYGRKPFILIGIGIFMVGTFMSGLSESIVDLIIYRGVQGFGAGMIISSAFTVIGDLFSPRERGKWQGIMSGVFGISSVLGPTLGGWIVDNADWHWVFWVFLPLGLVAFIMIWRLYPSMEKGEKEPVDYFGSLFLTLTIIPLLLASSWGGVQYKWSSLPIILLFIWTIISLIIFLMVERKVKSPVLPLHLFKNSIFSLSNIIGFLLGAGMFGAVMYMPFFIQGVMGTSATVSGFIMMVMTLGMVFSSTISGQLITKTGKYKIFALSGLAVMAIGLFLMILMNKNTTVLYTVLVLILTGIGLGLSFPVFTLTIQNSVKQKYLGVATASAQLFRQIGGTIGVAVMGTVLNLRMKSEMESAGVTSGATDKVDQLSDEMQEKLSELQNPESLMNSTEIESLREQLPEQLQSVIDQILMIVREGLSYALTGVFTIGAIIIVIAFILTFYIKEIPLRWTNTDEDDEPKNEKTVQE